MDKLLLMAQKKNRKESETAIDSLKDLFLLNLLPGKELKYLSGDTDNKDVKKAFKNDRIKHKYSDFLNIIVTKSYDTVENSKKNAIRCLGDLATGKPEARRQIMTAIVNKLGDPITSIPTMTILIITSFLKKRRDSLQLVVQELAKFLFRRNLTVKSKFYGIVMLNSLRLRETD